MQAREVARIRFGQRTQQAYAVLHHQVRGGHAGQQGNLFVPILDRMAGAEFQRPLSLFDADLLFRQRQADSATVALALLAQFPDLAQHRPHRFRLAVVYFPLHACIFELGPTPDPCAAHVHRDAFAAGIELHGPEQRRPHLARQQRRGIFRQGFGMQRNLGVGAVQRLATTMGFEVDCIPGSDECGDIGDRVMHAIAVSVALHEQRLVQVHRVRRIDGDESDVGAVLVRQAWVRRRGDRGLLDRQRECRRQVQLTLQPGHAAGQRGDLRRVQAQASCRRHPCFPVEGRHRF